MSIQVCDKFKEMMPNNIRSMRMAKEVLELARNPPHGITCWTKNDRNDLLEAIVQGSKETPYENGNFRIDIVIPERYPMDPPQLKFLTKVYHPNIDNSTGLICLDVLKMPPQGRWRPVHNLSLILTAVQQLLSDPNPHDPLDAAIAQEYIANRSLFLENAKKWTQLYAMEATSSSRPSVKRKSVDDSTSSETMSVKRLCTSSQTCEDAPSKPKSVDEPKTVESTSTSEDSENSIVISQPIEDVSNVTSKRKKVNEFVSEESVKRSHITPKAQVEQPTDIGTPEKQDRN